MQLAFWWLSTSQNALRRPDLHQTNTDNMCLLALVPLATDQVEEILNTAFQVIAP